MPVEELLKIYGKGGPPSETLSESAEVSSLAESEDEEDESGWNYMLCHCFDGCTVLCFDFCWRLCVAIYVLIC